MSAANLCLVVLLIAASSLQAPTVTASSCRAQWTRVLRTSNMGHKPLTETYKISYGIVRKDESSSSSTDSSTIGTEISGGLAGKVASISVSFSASVTHSRTTTQLQGTQLSRTTERTLTITVPPKTVLAVWQLQAVYGGFNVGFEDTEVRYDSNRPSGSTTCHVKEKQRARVTNWTSVRLKHQSTGKYLNTIRRKGWEAGTLGVSRDQHFRLERSGSYVRIRKTRPMFARYDVLYSSNEGGIYFDKYSSSHKQQWILSSNDPRDGDAVTFRNRNWQAGGLVKHDGPATNVYCISQHNLDKWVIEVV